MSASNRPLLGVVMPPQVSANHPSLEHPPVTRHFSEIVGPSCKIRCNKMEMEIDEEYSSILSEAWITRLQEENKREGNELPLRPRMVDMNNRRLIWKMCLEMGIRTEGIAGQVCRLIEQYAYRLFRPEKRLETLMADWRKLKPVILGRMPLLIASAIQISNKMSTNRDYVQLSRVQAVLMLNGWYYDVVEIVSAEMEVLKVLAFRIPLWTGVEAGEFLAMEAGLSEAMMPTVAAFIDLAELNRYNIEYCLVSTAGKTIKKVARSQVRTLHVWAGAVLAAARYLEFGGPDPLPRLAAITLAPCDYIKCVSNIILLHTGMDKPRTNVTRKRTAALLTECTRYFKCSV